MINYIRIYYGSGFTAQGVPVGFPIPSSLPIALGGLGIRRLFETRTAAYAASRDPQSDPQDVRVAKLGAETVAELTKDAATHNRRVHNAKSHASLPLAPPR